MTEQNNLWVDVLQDTDDDNTPNDALAFLQNQAKALGEASQGKVIAVFDVKEKIDSQVFGSTDWHGFAAQFSQGAALVAKAARSEPEIELTDINKLYRTVSYAFEIRSKSYRFRLFDCSIGYEYPIEIKLDEGVFEEAKSGIADAGASLRGACSISIPDCNVLEKSFKAILSSRKLRNLIGKLLQDK